MNPLVSIIIPSFQQAKYLRTAVDSVLSQDYQAIEVLVMDGGSTDGSLDILKSYGDKIWFRSRPDNGQCDAINEGFKKSKGEIVAWLNSDDFYYPGAIANAVDILNKNPQSALVYSEGNLVDEEGHLLWRFPETVPFDLWRIANHSDYILQPTVFFQRDKLFECGLLNEDLHWGLDWDLWIRIGMRYPFSYTEYIHAASRIYSDTKTATGGYRRLSEILRILNAHDVKGFSPAAVSHALITVVRRFCNNEELITPEVMSRNLPSGLGRVFSPLIERVERSLRKWLQNVQGVWQDGYVGKHGKLWLPSDGRRCKLYIRGKNLEIPAQKVQLRFSGLTVSSNQLKPGEAFELEVPIEEGIIPVKIELLCSKTVDVPPLDQRYGLRKAGFKELDSHLI